ncbi:PREDICTED: DNA fragmentation factor subunit beta [Vollenhovia emeryi]|uniref:DNA fragmentation factor subunit beta n=1 Tax=Vollenhovia emeryi TaxID=411798 RepID=UPI0005F4D3A6|nr:PREDICTED: DNA fragmentation factor subunit beta [Vollenhovia emeryi]
MSLIADCFRRLTDISSCKSELKGYKVTDVTRTRKIGIACRNLQDLKQKACLKLNVTNDPGEINVFLLDGSLIDEEYFHTLAPQTTLILQKPGEKVLSDADILYDALRRVNIDFLTAGGRVTQFLTENLKAKVALLNKVLNKDESKTALSTKEQHPEWFENLETNCMTKEAYMHRRCQDRIRAYLYKTIEQIKCSDAFMNDSKARQQLLSTIAFFKLQLKEDHYFGYYFDRSRAETDSKSDSDETDCGRCYDHCPCNFARINDETYLDQRYLRLSQSLDTNTTADSDEIDETDARKFLASEKKSAKVASDEKSESCPYRVKPRERQIAICDKKGEFRCEGRWNTDGCPYGDKHKINPYRSKEELALFSTWNLDHTIERSRTLIPKLLQLSRQDTINEQDIYDCYDNLFTVKNLRLVHIVCHDKGSHK